MKEITTILKRTRLFSGVGNDEISAMLNCLQAKLLTYKKGEYVFRQGEHVNRISLLTEGKLLVQSDDFWGNRSIINIRDAADTNVQTGQNNLQSAKSVAQLTSALSELAKQFWEKRG